MTDTQHPTDTAKSNEPFRLPTPEVIEDVEAVRKDRKERLAAGLRILGRLNLAEGVAGHVTARDPELTDHFWVNPFGHNFKLMTVSDLILVNHEGEVVEFISSPDGRSFMSRSENQAHMWLGPFDQKSLQLRLNQESHLCLSQDQRVKRLNERKDEAKEATLTCLKRKK